MENMKIKDLLRPKGKSAFTLIELLVVVAIILILAGLMFPAIGFVRNEAKKTKAKADVKQIEVAWKAVVSDYRTWTAAGLGEGNDYSMDSGNISYLQGNGGNTRKILYMEFPAGATSFLDPWKNVYHFALGTDSISPPNDVKLYRDVGAWSYGKNSLASDVGNHVTSWK